MSIVDDKDTINRSIRILDLPYGYKKDDILEHFKHSGDVEQVRCGDYEMIVTFKEAKEKELSKMYDGCPANDSYLFKLADADTLEVYTA